jgi:hypothetical protein
LGLLVAGGPKAKLRELAFFPSYYTTSERILKNGAVELTKVSINQNLVFYAELISI